MCQKWLFLLQVHLLNLFLNTSGIISLSFLFYWNVYFAALVEEPQCDLTHQEIMSEGSPCSSVSLNSYVSVDLDEEDLDEREDRDIVSGMITTHAPSGKYIT